MENPVFRDLRIKDNAMSFTFGCGERIATYNMDLSLLMECSSDDYYFYSPLDCILAGVRDAYKYVDMPMGRDPRGFSYGLMCETYLPFKNLVSYKERSNIGLFSGIFIDFLAVDFPILEIEITADGSEGGDYLDVEKYQCNINDMADAVLTTVIEWLFTNSIGYYSDNWAGHTFPIYNIIELAKVRYGDDFEKDNGFINKLTTIYNKVVSSDTSENNQQCVTKTDLKHRYILDIKNRANKVNELLGSNLDQNIPVYELVDVKSGWVDIRYRVDERVVNFRLDVFDGVMNQEIYNPLIDIFTNTKIDDYSVNLTVYNGDSYFPYSKLSFEYKILEWPVIEFKVSEYVYEDYERERGDERLPSVVVIQEEINALALLGTVVSGSLKWLSDNSHEEYHFNMFAWDHSGEFPLNTLIKLAKMLFQVEGELTYGQEIELLEAVVELNK